eukprot:m.14093 g.14093  ORF g.14093 m.14093 type:complete len:80 (+) comp8284_c0_seq1:1161-1400(+)
MWHHETNHVNNGSCTEGDGALLTDFITRLGSVANFTPHHNHCHCTLSEQAGRDELRARNGLNSKNGFVLSVIYPLVSTG